MKQKNIRGIGIILFFSFMISSAWGQFESSGQQRSSEKQKVEKEQKKDKKNKKDKQQPNITESSGHLTEDDHNSIYDKLLEGASEFNE
ncbi:MAG: hypothetical protein ACNA7V_10765 [Bacteroidales bacterium]